VDRKAQKLFSSKEEAITFAEDYGFDDAQVELLRTSGMILESAKVLVNAGRVADAVKALITPPRTRDCTRCAVEYLTAGLWKYQSFGMDHPTTDPEVVSELLELANDLRNDMDKQEAREVGCIIPLWYRANPEKHRSQCSEQGTEEISKPFISCIPSSS
jgi:hypothetical protein